MAWMEKFPRQYRLRNNFKQKSALCFMKRNPLAAICNELALKVLFLPRLAEETNSLCTRFSKSEEASKTLASKVQLRAVLRTRERSRIRHMCSVRSI